MMTGSPVSWCGSDGSWSPAWALVSCSRSCSYPGATIHGTINPVHFYYSPGQTVTYTCSEVSPALVTTTPTTTSSVQGFRLEGKPVLTCGKDGGWDAVLPRCVAKKV